MADKKGAALKWHRNREEKENRSEAKRRQPKANIESLAKRKKLHRKITAKDQKIKPGGNKQQQRQEEKRLEEKKKKIAIGT